MNQKNVELVKQNSLVSFSKFAIDNQRSIYGGDGDTRQQGVTNGNSSYQRTT